MSFLTDTNVLSELRIPGRAHPAVRAWSTRHDNAEFFISVITLMELEIGIQRKMRKDAAQGTVLDKWLNEQILPSFAGRILPVDQTVARACASMHVPDPRADRDALIAATALVHGLTVVTRNVADFTPMGVKVFNPWES